MGQYSDNLSRRLRETTRKKSPNTERLVNAAIIRNGETHESFRSHAQIRAKLKDEDIYNPTPGDREGFMTSKGRFVSRAEAVDIGIKSGQLEDGWYVVRRPLLSSDINW